MPFVRVVPVGPDELRAAGEIVRRFRDRDLTLIDAVGLHLMTARRTASCWSTGFHLGLTGVPLVVHEH